MLRGVIAFGAPNSQSTCLYAGATSTTSRNRAIRWVGDNHVASLRDRFFYIVLFFAFLVPCLRTATGIWGPVMLWTFRCLFGFVL